MSFPNALVEMDLILGVGIKKVNIMCVDRVF